MYDGYFGSGGVDPSGLCDENEGVRNVDPFRNLPSSNSGYWTGERGNSVFVCRKWRFLRLGKWTFCEVPYANGWPNFQEFIYSCEATDGREIAATVEIDYCSDLSVSDGTRRRRDFNAADAAMRKLCGEGWEKPDGFTWHHINVDLRGRGQIALVETGVHQAFSHAGAFACWREICKARETGDRRVLQQLHRLRRSMPCYIQKSVDVGKRAGGPILVLVFAIPTAAEGAEVDGWKGACAELGRDVVWADMAEAGYFAYVYPNLEGFGGILNDFKRGLAEKRFGDLGDTIDGRAQIEIRLTDFPECWRELYGTPYNPSK